MSSNWVPPNKIKPDDLDNLFALVRSAHEFVRERGGQIVINVPPRGGPAKIALHNVNWGTEGEPSVS